MKLGIITSAMVLGVAALATVGCNANDKLGDLGFKKGDNVVQTGVNKYNTLVDKDEACNQTWADYESALQRRADMVPQLVGVVKGAAAHEETTLVAVTQARASATRPEIKLDPKNDDFSDPDKFAAYQQAQSGLGAALGKLMVANENYPTIAANALFQNLQIQIEGTENRLNVARHDYNLAAADYNKELRHVSGKVINPLTGHEFKPRVYFSADANARQAPTVDFGTPAADKAVQPASK